MNGSSMCDGTNLCWSMSESGRTPRVPSPTCGKECRSVEQVRSAASRYVSPPEIAPHSAGAAVDLTLADADGRELDMGTRMNATPEESAGACYTQADNISHQARSNRDVLGTALGAAGLVNYPTEWWHWSYGDRYWALTTGADAACYGPKDLDSV
ncbi:D-alanyl-D-alanine dipeptidase [Streptomyces caelestis]|uniref:D-alanyl-D-alanine dipeptidase n=1 Tax=Streptomyces caelestis TaxID=36816 RepID=A0A7W9H497_9ACTN|nr:D-alanyl-D-alanine dipeptidase [Streptomyces caelestis]